MPEGRISGSCECCYEPSMRSSVPPEKPSVDEDGVAGLGSSPPEDPLSSEHYRAVLESLAYPVWIKDRDYRWVFVNRAFVDLLQLPSQDVVGKTDHDYFPKEQADRFREADRYVFATAKVMHNAAEPIVLANKVRHVFELTRAPLIRDDLVTHVAGTMVDVTRIGRDHDELKISDEEVETRVYQRTQALKNAQQALLRKERLIVLGQLTGGLAHQIRNPLAAISNAAAIVRRRMAGQIDAECTQALSILEEEVAESNRIISDLLDYASIRPPSRTPVECAHLIGSAIVRARPERGTGLSVDVNANAVVYVDERQTRDALGNVIRNAYEAAGESGAVTLRVTAESGCARIEVEDTGPGVAPEARIHLFEPLVSSKPLGLGLGLTTAKALIENQGGSIHYVQTHHGGARFDVILPLVQTT